MSATTLIVRASLTVVFLASTTSFIGPTFADSIATSAAGGNVSANSSDSGSPSSTSSQGSVSFSSGSQASGNEDGGGSANSNSHATASAEASAGAGSISLGLSSDAKTSVTSAGDNNNAIVDAAAAGSIGPAHLEIIAHADATSRPDQMTASAAANDGSYAIAQQGLVNGFESFVPGGTTHLIYNGSGTGSVSCNATGTCSIAMVANNSVSAGIRIVASTGTITLGNVEAVLSALLSVEASAGWNYVSAAATSSIDGSGHNSNVKYSTNVSADIRSSGKSVILRVTSSNNVKDGGNSAKIWIQGEDICASTKIQLNYGKRKLKTIVKCRHYKKYKIKKNVEFARQSHENWLTKLLKSGTEHRN
jgi:hypothetical protein